MATSFTLSFFNVGELVSTHDAYIWGETDLVETLKDAAMKARSDLRRARYFVIAKPQRDMPKFEAHYSANLLLEHLNNVYNVDEYFAITRYVLPVCGLQLVIQSVNAPHSLGSRAELKQIVQGSFEKESCLVFRTSPIEAPVHTLPVVSHHMAVLNGSPNNAVCLVVGELECTSSDANNLPLDATAGKMLLVINIELNFRRNEKVLPSGSNFQNRLVYFNAPNEALVQDIIIKSNLNAAADFNIPRMANVLMSSYMPDNGRRAEYRRAFQSSEISETILFDDYDHQGVPDMSMGGSFKFERTQAQYNQNDLYQIDTAMEHSFEPFNYDVKATPAKPTLQRIIKEHGPTTPKHSHPSYSFGLLINKRPTFVPNSTLVRYSFNLEHEYMEVYWAPVDDVLAYVPSDVVLSVHTSLFAIDGEGKHSLPITHMVADFPFIKTEPLPQPTIERLELLTVRLNFVDSVEQALRSRMLHEDTIIFKEEVKTDTPKATTQSGSIELTRLPPCVTQATFVIPQIDAPKAVRHLTWNRAGFTMVVPYYRRTNRINLVGGSTTPFEPAKLLEYLKNTTMRNTAMPHISLDKAQWLDHSNHIEFLFNPLRRFVHEIQYKMAGYTISVHPIAHCGEVKLQNLTHYRANMPCEVNRMLRVFNENGPRDPNMDHIMTIEYTYKGADLIKYSPRGMNLSKVNSGRIEFNYDGQLFTRMTQMGQRDSLVRFTVLHIMTNVQQSTQNISFNTFM